MDDELNALLLSAKSNLQQPADKKHKTETATEILNSIPKLESHLSISKEEAAPRAPKTLKALPELVKRKLKKPDTAGKQWFDMPKQEMTPELKRDLDLLRMRRVLDPKRFYKKEDPIGKYFAMGTIESPPEEFFSGRLTKRERKKTLAEEILATRNDYFRSKYKEIQRAKTSGGRKSQKRRRDMRA